MYYVKKNKSKKLILIFAAVMVVVTAAFFVMQTMGKQQSYRTVSIVEVSGRVGVVKDGVEYSAYPGMMLQEGHEIVTAGNSYVRLVLDSDKYVKLESGSKLVFETLGGLGAGKTRLCLERGALTTEVTKPLGADEEFVVNTPNAVLAVRGTFFRVEIKISQAGEINSHIMTYGGKVASKRIMPDGEVKDEDVLINAGYKTTINKTAEDTVYVVDDVPIGSDETYETIEKTEPIVKREIPDDDLVDIYYAIENGHELFVTSKEVKEDMAERNIDLENTVSVYEKAKDYIAPGAVVVNDSQPLVHLEDTEENGTNESRGDTESASNAQTLGTMTDGGWVSAEENIGEIKEEINEEKTHVHIEVLLGEETVHSKCAECGEVLSGTHVYEESLVKATCTEPGERKYTCECGYGYAVKIEALGHVEMAGATSDDHTVCEICGESLSGEHDFTEEVTKQATCMEAGVLTYSCECGYSYTAEIAMLEHVAVNGGTADCHSKCNLCDTVLGVSHEFVGTVTKQPSCAEEGSKEFACACGYSYTEEMDTLAHSEVAGAAENVHSKCSDCGGVLKDGTHHNYSQTQIDATCTVDGLITFSCDCGYSYSEVQTATGHIEAKGGKENVHAKCGSCGEILEDGSYHEVLEASRTEAGCTVDGVIVYACECGYGYEDAIPALGHTEVDGGEADIHVKCSVCGEVISDGSAHSLRQTRREPMCTVDGLLTYSCECGYSYSGVIPATGHTETDGGKLDAHTKCNTCGETILDGSYHNYEETKVDATCTADGSITYSCGCGYSYSKEILATGHTKADGGVETVHAKCGVCGEILEDGSAHSFTETTYEGNCLYNGILRRTCECGYSYDTELALGDHIPGNGGTEDVHSMCVLCGTPLEDGSAHVFTDQTTEATCTTTGMLTQTCDCGYVKETVLPKTDHNWEFVGTEDVHRQCSTCMDALEGNSYHDLSETTIPASCTEDGTIYYECECGYGYSTTLVKTGHTSENGGTKDVHTKCSTCGEVLADGTYHDFGSTSQITQATCQAEGLKVQTCGCGYEKRTILPMVAHSKLDAEASVTTCAYCGYAWVDVSEAVFPNYTFRESVASYDYDGDGALVGSDIAAITSLDVSGMDGADGNCGDLTGISYLTALVSLDCSYNAGLTTIDLSANTALTSIDVTGCTGLTEIYTNGRYASGVLTITGLTDESIVKD